MLLTDGCYGLFGETRVPVANDDSMIEGMSEVDNFHDGWLGIELGGYEEEGASSGEPHASSEF